MAVKPIINDVTDIVILLDRSGSMSSISTSTVNGFNEFVNEHKGSSGEANLTLIQFDDKYEVEYLNKDIKEVDNLVNGVTFVPRGTTALYDSIGRAINENTSTNDTIFVIITDGSDNRSSEFKAADIASLIKTKEDAGWKFVFLAANQDAVQTGASMGIKSSNSMTYSASAAGSSEAFRSVSSNVNSYRTAKTAHYSKSSVTMDSADFEDLERSLAFNDEQRNKSSKK